MNKPIGELQDRWLRLVGVPLIAVLGNFVFFQPDNDQHQISRLTALGLSLVECVLLWEISRWGIRLARGRYPRLDQTSRRIAYQVIWFLGTTVLHRLAITYLYDITRFWGYELSVRAYWINVLVPLLFSVPIAAIYEGRYLYRQWWTTYYEAERLKKENLQSQLDSLKSQINPHFLFNSLSTLSSLVSENPRQAERFIDELASVYRYVLQTNEQPLTTLDNELQFAEAYLHLLQTRFGEGVRLDFRVEEPARPLLLPPLTLQLLLENAVKHNVALPTRPLRIQVYTEAGELVVVNNRQKKQAVVPSSQTGLRNIAAKYQLLKQPAVLVSETDEQFMVRIPLITHSQYAHSHR